MSKTTVETLKKDHEIMRFYFEGGKLEYLDYYISDIIKSNDLNRMRGVLTLFKQFRNETWFKETADLIVSLIEKQTGSKIV